MGTDIQMFAEIRERDAHGCGAWRAHVDAEGHLLTVFNYRNSVLFAALADVRGTFSAARGIAVPSIDGLPGLPGDLSPEVARAANAWLEDGFGYSCLSLRQILEHDWDAPIRCRGWARREHAAPFRSDAPPPAGVPFLRAGLVFDPDFVEVAYTQPLREQIVPPFFDDLLPLLKSLGGPDDVRIVFWFSC